MISNAFQRGSSVYVIGENGRPLFVRSGELHAFTGASITIRLSGTLQTFNERGTLIGTTRA